MIGFGGWAATMVALGFGAILSSPVGDRRDFSSYEAIAGDPTIRLAAVAGQVQIQTALEAGVPQNRILTLADQETAALAVKGSDADASVSTAPGNVAFLARAGEGELVAIADQRAGERGPVAVGAFSFSKEAHELTQCFDDSLAGYLGTDVHLATMARYGLNYPTMR